MLVGIGESAQDRTDALRALADVHAEHGHLQEVILQNFVVHRRYHGQEPAAIATAAAETFWHSGLRDFGDRESTPAEKIDPRQQWGWGGCPGRRSRRGDGA